MGRLRSLRRLLARMRRDASGPIVIIPQVDGTVVRFSEQDLAEAYLRNYDIGRAKHSGEEPPEPHPAQRALQNAATRESWHETYTDMLEAIGPVEDLSEP